MIRAALFDFDLTLADSTRGVVECVNYALARMGLQPLDQDRIIATIGLPLPRVCAMLTGNEAGGAEFSRLFVERADQVMVELTTIFPDVRQTLTQLRRDNVRIAIVSTKFRYRIASILRRESLEPLVDLIVGGEDVRRHKPDPEGLLYALRMLNVAAAQAVYVGDHPVDAEAARSAGVRFVGVLNSSAHRDAFTADSVLLPSIAELTAHLRARAPVDSPSA